ncbi:MFS transporter [Cupriavidus basilensis]|uniref:MFS transporter n=1 Tax=Cupriavidus basilensis TaxID=68895 RepID=UPI00157BB572|nr:MFS transporter [Cupriavidus basilensis]
MSEAFDGGRLEGGPTSAARLAHTIPALGIAQIASWGSLYYAFAVLAKPIQADLHLSQPEIFGAFTFALLTSSLCAPRVGRAIDRLGGKRVLCVGSLVAATALLAMACVTDVWTVYAAWMLAGLAMPMALYDPAFATLHQLDAARYRRSVSTLTLFGGFASTVFWPLTAFLNAELGWRMTLLVFAGIQIAVCLPLHGLVLPRLSARAQPQVAARAPDASPSTVAGKPFFLLAGAFAAALFVFGALSVHLLNLLQAGGLSTAQAVMVASVIGPMQVTGRVMELVFAKRLPPVQVGWLSLSLLVVALPLLASSPGSIGTGMAFAVVYGLSNGLLTIVRGTLPADLFPGVPVGSLLGRLARPTLLSMAIAPLCFSLVSASGVAFVGLVLVLLGLASLALLLLIAATRQPRVEAAEVGEAQIEAKRASQ